MRGQRREGRNPSVEPELRSAHHAVVVFYPQIPPKSRKRSLDVTASFGHPFRFVKRGRAVTHPKGIGHVTPRLSCSLECCLFAAVPTMVVRRYRLVDNHVSQRLPMDSENLGCRCLLWAWSDEQTLGERFRTVRKIAMRLAEEQQQLAKTYQAFRK